MACKPCTEDKCYRCVDIFRRSKKICNCERENHDGEPHQRQIKDPFNRTVYMPGGEVDVDGNVTFYDLAKPE